MNFKKDRRKFSIKAKVIYLLIPIMILALIEILFRFLIPSNENKNLNKITTVPDLVSTSNSQSLDSNILLANYNKLFKPVEQLPFHQYDKDLLYCPKPNSSFTFMIPGFYVVNYSINSLGFRGKEISFKKPEKIVRIICAGDSSTFGFKVNLEDTYPKQLEMLLSKSTKKKNYEVINAGIFAFNTLGGVLYLEKKLRKLHPDILVFSYGFNDTFFKTRPLEKTTILGKTVDVFLEKGLYKLAIYNFLDKFIKKFIIGKNINQHLGPNVRPEEFKANLEKAIKICKEDGIHLIFMPISICVSYAKIMKDIANKYGIGYIDIESALTEYYQKFIKERNNTYEGISIGKLMKIPFNNNYYEHFNSLEMMKIRERNYLFMDYCHPSPIGYRIIAEEIYKYLIKNRFFTPSGNDSFNSHQQYPKIQKSSLIPLISKLE
jgi:lysophospholipase L1-like esterase